MNPETKLQRQIMMALSEAGHTVWRNETGRFWTGRVIHNDARMVTLSCASMVPVGLCVGSSDLIAIQAYTGRFCALEVKTAKGRATKEQKAYIEHVNRSGGIAGIVRSVGDAVSLLANT